MTDRDIEQRIRERAFYIWIEQGQPQGKDIEHWQRAETELSAETASLTQEQVGRARGDAAPAETLKPVEAEPPHASPGVEAIGQIKFAAARDVDQGGSAQRQQQCQSVAQGWAAYRR